MSETRRVKKGKPAPEPEVLSEEEQLELELAEQARVSSGDWDSVKPGKAANFGQSFKRLVGLLRPRSGGKTAWVLLGVLMSTPCGAGRRLRWRRRRRRWRRGR